MNPRATHLEDTEPKNTTQFKKMFKFADPKHFISHIIYSNICFTE